MMFDLLMSMIVAVYKNLVYYMTCLLVGTALIGVVIGIIFLIIWVVKQIEK